MTFKAFYPVLRNNYCNIRTSETQEISWIHFKINKSFNQGFGVDEFCNFYRSCKRILDIFISGVVILKQLTASGSSTAVQTLKFKSPLCSDV